MSKLTQYYTSADALVFVESGPNGLGAAPVLLDTLSHIQFRETLSARAIYGVGHQQFGFTSLGNSIIQGDLSVRFMDPNYLLNAVKAALGLGGSRDLEDVTFSSFVNATQEEIAERKNAEKKAESLDQASLMDIPQDFNIRIVLNNGNLYHADTSKTIMIKGVRIVGNGLAASVAQSGPLNDSYQFLARSITRK